jgi:hypothetical protein
MVAFARAKWIKERAKHCNPGAGGDTPFQLNTLPPCGMQVQSCCRKPLGMNILAEGEGAYLEPDPDGFRAWVRDHKLRTLVNKLMSEQEAVVRFVSGGDYFAYDCNDFQRGPSALLREVIRQGKKDV